MVDIIAEMLHPRTDPPVEASLLDEITGGNLHGRQRKRVTDLAIVEPFALEFI